MFYHVDPVLDDWNFCCDDQQVWSCSGTCPDINDSCHYARCNVCGRNCLSKSYSIGYACLQCTLCFSLKASLLNIPQTKQLATMTTAADSNQPTRVAKVAVQIFSAIYASIHLVSSIYWVFFVCVFRTNCFLVGSDFRGWIGG
jgi:hypothetical protein